MILLALLDIVEDLSSSMAKFGLSDVEIVLEGHGGDPVIVRYMKRIYNYLRFYIIPDTQKLTLWNGEVQIEEVFWLLQSLKSELDFH